MSNGTYSGVLGQSEQFWSDYLSLQRHSMGHRVQRLRNALPRSRARNPNGPDDIEILHNKLGRKQKRPTGMLKNTDQLR